MGLWSACQPVGNIVGAIIASFTLPMGYQVLKFLFFSNFYLLKSTFVFNSIIIFIGAIIMLIFVKPKPQLGAPTQLLTCEIPNERRVVANGIHPSEFDGDNQEMLRFI